MKSSHLAIYITVSIFQRLPFQSGPNYKDWVNIHVHRHLKQSCYSKGYSKNNVQ